MTTVANIFAPEPQKEKNTAMTESQSARESQEVHC